MLPREVLLDRFHLRYWDWANLSFACNKHYAFALSTNSCKSSYRRALTPAERWDETLILLPPIYHTIPDLNVRMKKELSHVHLSVWFPPAPAFAIVAAPAFASSKGSGVGFRKSKVTSYACPAVKKQSIVRTPSKMYLSIFHFSRRKKTVKQGRRSKESLMLGLSKLDSLVAYRAMCLEGDKAPLYHTIYMVSNPTLSSFSPFFPQGFFDQCRITLFY